MATDDVYKLALRATLNGKDCVNTFAFRMKSNPEPTTAMFANLADNLATVIEGIQVDDLTYVDWRAQQVRGTGTTYSTTPPFSTSTVSYSGGFGSTFVGDLTGTPLPNNVAMCVTVNTAQSGRRRKGRFFIAGIAEVWVDDNSLFNATQLATAQTMLDGIVTTYGAAASHADFELGVWSERIATNAKYVNTVSGPVLTSQGAPSPSTAYAGCTSLQARNFVASQRDRRPGI